MRDVAIWLWGATQALLGIVCHHFMQTGELTFSGTSTKPAVFAILAFGMGAVGCGYMIAQKFIIHWKNPSD